MDITQLRYFLAISQSGSMSKAAEILHVSQPALSKVTRLLQEELGVQLIRHVGRQIILTEQGLKLCLKAEKLISQFDQIKNELEDNQLVQNNEIKIATFEVFSTYALDFLNHIDWNENTLTMHEVLPGELEESVANCSVDFGLTYMPVPHPTLEHLKIGTVEMGVFGRAGSFPALKQNELPFVVPVNPLHSSPSRVRGLDGWPDDAYPRKIKYKVTLMETALELCRQGRAVGFFPLFVIQLHNKQIDKEFKLVRKPSIYPGRVCKTDVYVVKRKSDVENKQIKQLAKGIRLICNLE
jgi:DNA-binding transcriptional LysR family regulator